MKLGAAQDLIELNTARVLPPFSNTFFVAATEIPVSYSTVLQTAALITKNSC